MGIWRLTSVSRSIAELSSQERNTTREINETIIIGSAYRLHFLLSLLIFFPITNTIKTRGCLNSHMCSSFLVITILMTLRRLSQNLYCVKNPGYNFHKGVMKHKVKKLIRQPLIIRITIYLSKTILLVLIKSPATIRTI
ncbi:MAG: hypothetical protein BWX60_00848 [Candidatus Marinimicrobia bacterium ADurb.Bin030]|nr:MAG: hypothetical protein BWX60_00848 [Candidatus Marinimicrobia bacterium ADurb.Bin030]